MSTSAIAANTSGKPGNIAAALVVSALGVCCRSGDQPFALFGAVAGQMSGSEADAQLSLAVPGGDEDAKVLTARVAALGDDEDPHERMGLLAETALDQALKSLPEDFDWERLLILTLVPDGRNPRALTAPALQRLQMDLSRLREGLSRVVFRFVSCAEGAVSQLQAACGEMKQGKWQAVLFGGVDSLVDLVTCTLLAQEDRIATTHNSEGLVPGEGAAYVLLQQEPATASLARLAGIGCSVELHAGDAVDKRMSGLSTAVATALAASNLPPEAIDCVVAPHDGSLSGALEWYQTVERLFPRREASPRDFEELLLCRSFGELGAAALPLSLALGCARLEFTYPSVKHVMVCETGESQQRGAVLIMSCLMPISKGAP